MCVCVCVCMYVCENACESVCSFNSTLSSRTKPAGTFSFLTQPPTPLTTNLPLSPEVISSHTVQVDSVSETAVISEVDEFVVDSIIGTHTLPENKEAKLLKNILLFGFIDH